MPRISIITPSTNQPALMERTIGSVLAQEYSPLEYLIIDCGMSDEVRTLVESYAGKVVIVAAGADSPWQQAVNKGVAAASGSIFAWLMPGDCYLPGALQEIARCAADNPAAGLIVGGGEWCADDGAIIGSSVPGEVSMQSLYHWPDEPFVGGASFVTMDAWNGCGPLQEGNGYASELDLWLKIARRYPVCSTAKPLVRARAISSTVRYRLFAHSAQTIQRHGGEAEARHYLERLVTTFEERQRDAQRLLAAKERESAEKSQRIEALIASVSWKITSPLRTIDRGLKSIFRKRYEKRRESRPSRKQSLESEKWPDDLPLVSVIIPCFNYGEFVVEAIDSVLEQTFRNLEIIVVDGGSDDDATLRVLRSLDKKKTTVYFRDKPCLVGDNRNFGIDRARGKYICCLDADDLLRPTYLEKAVFMAESYGYDIVYPSVQCFGGDDHVWHVGVARFPDIARQNEIATVALFRRDAWAAVGGYRDWGQGEEHVPEDWEFWVRLLGNGYRACRIPEPLMLYRVHGHGLTALNRRPVEHHRQLIAEANRELFDPVHILSIQKREQMSYAIRNPFANLTSRRKERPHILLFVSSMVRGGVDTVLLRLIPHLREKGFEITVVATVPPLVSEGESVADYEQVTEEIFPLYKFLEQRDQWKDFVDYLIATRETDIILQVGCEYLYGILPHIAKANPDLAVVDQIFNEIWIEGYNRRYRKYIDVTVVENESLVELFRDRFHEPQENIRLLPNGVDLVREFVPERWDGSRVKAHYGLSPDSTVIVFIGRLSSEKGPDLFLDIMGHFRDDPMVYAVMAGQGPLFTELNAKIEFQRLEDRILMPGYVSSGEILAMADLLIVPSRLDGRPNVILEGLAMGVPVIASAVGGIPGLVRDGETGYLCAAGDSTGFAEKIRLLVRDFELRQRLAHNARQFAEERLDIRTMLDGYVQLFTELTRSREKK